MLRIKVHRILRELSQDQLAVASGVPQSYISRFETGRGIPTDQERKALARVLGCPPEQLLDHVDESTLLAQGNG